MKKHAYAYIVILLAGLCGGCLQPSASIDTFIELKGHTDSVNSAIFSPDDKKIVTGSMDGTARIWDAKSGKELYILEGHTDWSKSVTVDYSPDGKKIGTWEHLANTVQIWDAESGEKLHTLDGQMVHFSPDGKKVVTLNVGDGAFLIWDAESGKELQKVSANVFSSFGGRSPDRKKIVLNRGDITFILDFESEKGQQMEGRFGNFSSDCKKVATISRDEIIRIWDVKSGKELLNLKGQTANLSPNGTKIATGNFDDTIRICDAGSGKELHQLEGMTGTFLPDGKKIVTADKNGITRIWDVASGEELRQLQGEMMPVFSPDGKKMIMPYMANKDVVKQQVWDVESGKVQKLEGIFAAFSSDGKKFVTINDDNIARIWVLE